MKVNVDVLVLNQAEFSGDNQSRESVRKSISNLYTGHDVSNTKIYNSNVQIYVMQNSYTKIF